MPDDDRAARPSGSPERSGPQPGDQPDARTEYRGRRRADNDNRRPTDNDNRRPTDNDTRRPTDNDTRRPTDNDDLSERFGIDDAADEQPRSDGPPPSGAPRSPAGSPAEDASVSRPAEGGTPTSGGRQQRKRGTAKPRRKAPWWELPALIALAIAIAILVKSFLVQPFYIPSESMERTLHGCQGCSGDRILVSKIVYDFRDPHPGDIVVFNAPTGWDDEPKSVPPSNPVVRTIRGFGQLIGFVPPDGLVLVKRVIAVGGQTVRGFARNGVDVVQISDHGTTGPWRTLDEPFVYETPGYPDARAKFGPVTVPKGRLWVMGDHRDASADSRYHCQSNGGDEGTSACADRFAATVPDGNVIGKAVIIAWPPSRWTTLGTPKTFTSDTGAIGATGALAANGAAPGVSLGLVLPVFVLRRRRRRRR